VSANRFRWLLTSPQPAPLVADGGQLGVGEVLEGAAVLEVCPTPVLEPRRHDGRYGEKDQDILGTLINANKR
jgi:hypothetical protein